MAITDATKRWLWERRLRANAELMEQVVQLRERVFDAFAEGFAAGMDMRDPAEAWQSSWSRRDLYPGPPTPMVKRGLRGVPYRRGREPGGPGDVGMNDRARVDIDEWWMKHKWP